MTHQCLGATERCGDTRQPDRIEKLARRLAPAREFDGDHRAAVAHLPLGQFELRMAGQSRIVHRRHRRVFGQRLGEVERRFGLM